jgi:hypothetical protein
MLLSLSVLACLYLIRADTIKALRPFYIPVGAVLFLNMMLAGSRKALFGLILAFLIPAFFPKRVLRKPLAFIGAAVLVLILVGMAAYGLENVVPEEVAWRFRDKELAEDAITEKLAFIEHGVGFVLTNPLGSGLGVHRTDQGMAIHNDFFYLLANLGYIGAALYLVMFIPLVVHIRRSADSIDKTFASWLVIFLFLCQMSAPMLLMKFVWLFYALAWIAASSQVSWDRQRQKGQLPAQSAVPHAG